MKHFFTNKLFVFFLVSVSLFSCQDKEEELADVTAVNPGACQLSKTEDTDAGGYSDNKVIVPEYNPQGYITKETRTDYEYGAAEYVYVTTYEYNASNQLIKKDGPDGYTTSYETYQYNADGTVSKRIWHASFGSAMYFETYTYDANKRVIESVQDYSGMTYKTGYEYDGNDNISRVNHYSPDNRLVRIEIYENYDKKLNPLYFVKGAFVLGQSKHNPGKFTYIYDSNDDGVANANDDKTVTTYAYKYNGNGYATEIVRKEEGKKEEKTTFTYSGCN
jgi:hypothetical protein